MTIPSVDRLHCGNIVPESAAGPCFKEPSWPHYFKWPPQRLSILKLFWSDDTKDLTETYSEKLMEGWSDTNKTEIQNATFFFFSHTNRSILPHGQSKCLSSSALQLFSSFTLSHLFLSSSRCGEDESKYWHWWWTSLDMNIIFLLHVCFLCMCAHVHLYWFYNYCSNNFLLVPLKLEMEHSGHNNSTFCAGQCMLHPVIDKDTQLLLCFEIFPKPEEGQSGHSCLLMSVKINISM